jgi:ribonuclease HII
LGALSSQPQRIIIDGILGLPLGCGSAAEVHTVIEGDAQYLAVAAASILAKVLHDRWLQGVVDEQPDLDEKYRLRSCKGYGTAAHRAGIETHGLHASHRRRFIKGYRPGEACLVKFKSAAGV